MSFKYIARAYERLSTILRHASGWGVRGCLLGIVVACVYNFLFINLEIGALSEQSRSEDKAIYGIKLFGTRVIVAAILGAALGALVEVGKASPPHAEMVNANKNTVRFSLRKFLGLTMALAVAFGLSRQSGAVGTFLVTFILAGFLASLGGTGRMKYVLQVFVTTLSLIASIALSTVFAEFFLGTPQLRFPQNAEAVCAFFVFAVTLSLRYVLRYGVAALVTGLFAFQGVALLYVWQYFAGRSVSSREPWVYLTAFGWLCWHVVVPFTLALILALVFDGKGKANKQRNSPRPLKNGVEPDH